MKNMLKPMALLALMSSAALAGTDTTAPAAAAPAAPAPAPDKDKEVAKQIQDQGIYVETAKPGVTLSGYVDAGASFNGDSSAATASLNGRTVNNVRFGADSGTRDGANLNAFKLALEKPLGDKNDYVAGFRADLMYGQDAGFLAGKDQAVAAPSAAGVQGAANTTGGLGDDFFVEQAFVQFRAPVGNGIDFHIGRFVTPMGYEVIERPANLNITYGNLFVNMIPLYHQGAEATYKFNDTVNVLGAVVDGWNNSHPFNIGNTVTAPAGASSNPNNGGVIGQVNVNSPGGNANITNTVYYGWDGDSNALGNATANNQGLVVVDSWGNWKPKFANDNWLLGYNADYGECGYDDTISGAATGSKTEQWYGVALYSKYQFTKIFSLAGRADWIHDLYGAKWAQGDDAAGAFEGGPGAGTTQAQAKSNDVYSYTITSSFDIWENMILKGEYRCDWGNDWGVNGSVGGVSGTNWGMSHLFTAEVVYSF